MITKKDAPIEAMLKEVEAKFAKKMKNEHEARLKEAKSELEKWMKVNFQAFICNFMTTEGQPSL